MLTKLLTPNPFKTFYLVFAYILLFALWWAYLLYEKNETAYKEKIELNQIRFRQLNSSSDYNLTEEFQTIYSKYQRQRLMIISEGSAFILLLLFGLLRVRKVFLREMKLAAQQRNFLLSITHELKSPVSSVKLALQTLAKRRLEPEKSEKLIGNSLDDLDRLESLVDNILFAAKIEHDKPGFANEEFNASKALQEIAEKLSHNKKSILISADLQPGVIINTDIVAFTSVIINLLENAIKYSPDGNRVSMIMKEEGDQILISVEDEGIGIPADEKERIFEKFYRVGNEDTRRTKGTGLGLYIVKRFVEIYNGSIYVFDNPSGGSVFKIALPVQPN